MRHRQSRKRDTDDNKRGIPEPDTPAEIQDKNAQSPESQGRFWIKLQPERYSNNKGDDAKVLNTALRRERRNEALDESEDGELLRHHLNRFQESGQAEDNVERDVTADAPEAREPDNAGCGRERETDGDKDCWARRSDLAMFDYRANEERSDRRQPGI